jgi:hypothetical protein
LINKSEDFKLYGGLSSLLIVDKTRVNEKKVGIICENEMGEWGNFIAQIAERGEFRLQSAIILSHPPLPSVDWKRIDGERGDRRMDELVVNGKAQAKGIRTSGSDQKCSFKRGLECAAVARLTLSSFYLAGNGF